jgi:hypothetical protein
VAGLERFDRKDSASTTIDTLFVNSGDIGGFAESVGAREHGEPRLDGDASAALEAAALKHELTGAGGHAGQEPVDALTTLFLWLIRSL